jgi:tripeptidyl-peptidase-1
MMIRALACLLLCATIIGAANTKLSSDYLKYEVNRKIMNMRHAVPDDSDYITLGRAAPQDSVKYTFVLKQKNLDLLEAALYDAADPKSANYGKWWTRQQVMDLIAPDTSIIDEFTKWFNYVAFKSGKTYNMENKGDAIVVRSSVAFAETLFATQLHRFESENLKIKTIKHMGPLSVPSKYYTLFERRSQDFFSR